MNKPKKLIVVRRPRNPQNTSRADVSQQQNKSVLKNKEVIASSSKSKPPQNKDKENVANSSKHGTLQNKENIVNSSISKPTLNKNNSFVELVGNSSLKDHVKNLMAEHNTETPKKGELLRWLQEDSPVMYDKFGKDLEKSKAGDKRRHLSPIHPNHRNQTNKAETSIRGKELFQGGRGRKGKDNQNAFAKPSSPVKNFNSKQGKSLFAPSSLSRVLSAGSESDATPTFQATPAGFRKKSDKSQDDSLEIGHDETFDIEAEDDEFGHSQMSEDSRGEEEQNEVDSEIEDTESEIVEPEPTKAKIKRNMKMNEIPARESDLFLGFSKPIPPGPSKMGPPGSAPVSEISHLVRSPLKTNKRVLSPIKKSDRGQNREKDTNRAMAPLVQKSSTRTHSAESGLVESGFKVPAPKAKSNTTIRSSTEETREGTRTHSAESGFQDNGFKAPAPKTSSGTGSKAVTNIRSESDGSSGGTRTNSSESAFIEPGFKMPSAPPIIKKSKKHKHLESTTLAPPQTTALAPQQTTSLHAQDISMIPHSQSSVPNLLPPITVPQGRPGKTRYLQNWTPRLRNNRLFIEGTLIDLDNYNCNNDQRWLTSKIVARVSPKIVSTKSSDYVLEGSLYPSAGEEELDGPTPLLLLHSFAHGFPDNWQSLVEFWKNFAAQEKRNEVNRTILYNSILATGNTSLMPGQDMYSSLMTTMSLPGNISQFQNNFKPVANSSVLPVLQEGSSMSNLYESRIVAGIGQPATLQANSTILQTDDRPRKDAQNQSRVKSSDRHNATAGQQHNTTAGQHQQLSTANNSQSHRAASRDSVVAVVPHDDTESEIVTGAVESTVEPIVEQERVGRSPGVRVNKNSKHYHQRVREEAVSRINMEDTGAVGGMNATMSVQDFSVLRAKTYPNIKQVKGKKSYACEYCENNFFLFNELKMHIRKNHLEGGEEGVSSRRRGPVKKDPEHVRARSDESLLGNITTQINQSKRTQSDSPYKTKKVREASQDLDPDLNPTRKGYTKDSTLTSKKLEDKRSASRSDESKSRTRDDTNKETHRKSFTFQGVPVKTTEKSKSSNKSKERDTSLNAREKQTETIKPSSEEPLKEDLNDFIYENKQYTCIYCPISFHPLKSRALMHCKAAKHKKFKKIELEKRSEVDDDAQKYENRQDDNPTKNVRPVESSNDRLGHNSPARAPAPAPVSDHAPVPDPAPAPARKRGRSNRNKDQTRVPSSELEFEEEPAAKRGRPKRTAVNKKKANYDDDYIQPELEQISKQLKQAKTMDDNPPEVTQKKRKERPSKKVVDKENVESRTEGPQDRVRDNSPDIPQASRREKKRPKVRVENPLKKRALETRNQDSNKQYVDLREITANPKTLKARRKNEEIFSKLNENHEDDIFGGGRGGGTNKGGFNLLGNSDESSGSEMSMHSARTPIQKYMSQDNKRMEAFDTPLISPAPEDSPLNRFNSKNNEVYVHKRLLEKRNVRDNNKTKKKKITLAMSTDCLTKNTKQKKIDASCRLIGTMSQQQVKAASKHRAANYDDDTDQEDDDDNDWLDEDEEEEEFTGSKLSTQGSLLHSLSKF